MGRFLVITVLAALAVCRLSGDHRLVGVVTQKCVPMENRLYAELYEWLRAGQLLTDAPKWW